MNGGSAQAAEIFRFESFDSVEIANSRFEKNENQGGIVIVDVPEDVENMTMKLAISFENITVVKNNENNNSLVINLFDFKSPRNSIQSEFVNCLFQDNEICKHFMVVK